MKAMSNVRLVLRGRGSTIVGSASTGIDTPVGAWTQVDTVGSDKVVQVVADVLALWRATSSSTTTTTTTKSTAICAGGTTKGTQVVLSTTSAILGVQCLAAI